MNRLPVALVLALIFTLGAAGTARAELQTSGPQVFPGKLQVGFHPLGGQTGFNFTSVSGYKLTADIAGLIAQPGQLSLWLGGGVNYTAGLYRCNVRAVGVLGNCGHDLQLWMFVLLSFEKLINIPLVPFVRAGLGGDVLIYSPVGGAFIFRVGAGVHYWLIKNIGLGVETNFTFGPGFYGGLVGTAFYGTWDIGLGARFAF